MKSVRRVIAAAAVSTLLIAAAPRLGPVSVPAANAETGVSVVDRCSAPADAQMRVSVLLLLDNSGSLRTNDPNDLRVSGTKDAVIVLDGLSGQFDSASISVAIDSFNTNYRPGAGWLPADGASAGLLPRIDGIAAIPPARTSTDYTQAMTGAWERFRSEPADCRLLIWFTDGEHVTVPPAEEVHPEEWAALSELCDSPAMEFLRDNVWVGAVRLIADRDDGQAQGSAETLQYLFEQEDLGCANSLRGQVYDDFNPADLGRVLHDIIATATDDLIFREDPDKLPNEPDNPPADDEYEGCTDGDGTPEAPCQVPLPLRQVHESFRAFVDLTFIKQGVRNPDHVKISVRSPKGHLSPSIGGNGDIDPAETDGEYRAVPPFGFYTRAQYASEIQIVGHQAAKTLTDPNRWPWQWEGDWALLFYGDTPEAQADARRAAAAVIVHTEDSPVADSLGIDSQCTLSGFVDNYPTEDYSDVELRIRIDDASGVPVYPTRPYLTDEPLPIEEFSRRFAVDNFLDRLASWDDPQQGGNDMNLRASITESGGLAAVAVLIQRFRYAGQRELLPWERAIGKFELSQQQLDHIEGLLSGRDGDPLLCLPVGPPPGLDHPLPTDLSLGGLQDDWDGASFEVSAVPSELPAVLSLNAEGAEIISEGASSGAAPFAAAGFDQLEWSCDVPAASEADGSLFVCPDRITVPISSELPLRPTLRLRFPLGVAEQPGSVDALLRDRGYVPDSEAYRLRFRILDDALAQERRSETLEGALAPKIDPEARWLPSNLEVVTQPSLDPDDADDDTTMHMRVTARPAELPAELSLRDVVLTQSSSDGSGDGEEVIETLEVGPWNCSVAAAAGEGRRFRCPEPITVELPAERDTGLSLVTTVCTSEQPESVDEFLARFGLQPGSGDLQQLANLIAEALSDERGCFMLPQQPDPSPGDTLREFWPMLVVLTAVALAARVGIAWRLRPWNPIDSADYATLTFPDDGLDVAAGLSSERREVCMDLRRSRVSAQIEGIRLRSCWLPLLLGRAPALTASSQSGHCIGPKGCKPRPRRGSSTGLIGPDLARGWIVEWAPGQRRLIVWDLPMDSDDARSRITDSAREAAQLLEQHLESGRMTAPMLGTGTGPAEPTEASPGLAGGGGPDGGDPFAPGEGPSQPWAPQDDIDPFGRDNQE